MQSKTKRDPSVDEPCLLAFFKNFLKNPEKKSIPASRINNRITPPGFEFQQGLIIEIQGELSWSTFGQEKVKAEKLLQRNDFSALFLKKSYSHSMLIMWLWLYVVALVDF